MIAAYGGADRWRQVDTIKVHQIVGGPSDRSTE
jgi:hypothetical protein